MCPRAHANRRTLVDIAIGVVIAVVIGAAVAIRIAVDIVSFVAIAS